MDLNKVMLIGNLTRDPETRSTTSGHQVCNFTLAANSGYGERQATLFIKCEAWQKTAEIADQYLRKGSQCLVEGRLKIEEYQTKEGEKRRDPVVVVEKLSLGARPKGEEGGRDERRQENRREERRERRQ